ncbi:MAG: M20/M25/M40 family metallo-hydrolase [Planctomycetales bacterium]|nr:M20/M25/M40 family metallo-hydrolase [Planctomycetales bacterium]
MKRTIFQIAKMLLNQPTAPYREDCVRRGIAGFCADRGMAVRTDSVGNVIAVYGDSYPDSRFVFAAHMDHPGFIVEKNSRNQNTTALFYGGVEEPYFKNARVTVFTESKLVKGTVAKTRFDKRRRRVWLKLDGDVQKGDAGMWDLPACRIRGGRLYSRACDDLVGCISILAMLDQLYRRKIRKKVTAVFTVAEEAGLHGAKHLCATRQISRHARLIAIETSSALPDAKIGDGVVVRVGDRTSIFTPELTAFLTEAARRIQTKDKRFKVQRKLMDAGTCESTVYSRFGYAAAAVCIPLGNYHNRNVRTKKIAAEFVSPDDLENMVKLFVSVVKNSSDAEKFIKPGSPSYKKTVGRLGEFFYVQKP